MFQATSYSIMNNQTCVYDYNNINQSCYCYTISDEEQENIIFKHLIKICDMILILFTFVVIGIQCLKSIHNPKYL